MAGGALRKIVRIDEEKCTGCGLCVPGCVEGALQIVDGKAKLISETYCDGLGACLGECPEGAITMEERTAEEFDEEATRRHMAPQAPACSCTGSAAGHSGTKTEAEPLPCGCPGSAVRQFEAQRGVGAPPTPEPFARSALSQWPVQLTLVPPTAPFLKQADLLLVADCVPFAYAGFHGDIAQGACSVGGVSQTGRFPGPPAEAHGDSALVRGKEPDGSPHGGAVLPRTGAHGAGGDAGQRQDDPARGENRRRQG